MSSVNTIFTAVLLTALSTVPWHHSPPAAPQARVASAFTKGNVVVVRVGTGNAPLATGGTTAACFLDEYDPAGTLVQSIALPATAGATKAFTLSGTATSEGYITRSPDGLTLALAGYNADAGTAGITSTTSAAVNRIVALISEDGTINLETALSDAASGNNVRGACTNGVDVWITGGAGGVRHAVKGGTVSEQVGITPTNLRAVNIFGNQLYVSTANGTAVRIGTVGTGMPTSGQQAITNLPGLPTGTASPNQFFMADLSNSVPGMDVLYIADDNNTTGGILKYSLVNDSWTFNGSTGVASELYRGLTGRQSGNTVTLYAVKGGGSGTAGGGVLVSLTDNAGYNAAATAGFSTLATASTNQAFRGVALAPELAALPLNLLAFNSAQQGKSIRHTWRTEKENGVDRFELQHSYDGEKFNAIVTIKAQNSSTGSYEFAEPGSISGTAYYRLKIFDKDESFTFSKINRLATELNSTIIIYPNPVRNNVTIRFEKLLQKGRLQLMTVGGVNLREIILSPGMQEIKIDLSDVRPGIYLLQSEINGTKKSSRLEKK